MDDRRLFVMCGLPFAGKTTIARAIRDQAGGVLISLDEINAERGAGFGGDGLSDETWAETLRVGVARLEAAMAGGAPIVVDDTACYRWMRDGYREIAARHGYRATLVLLDVPRVELDRRRAANAADPVRRGIRDEVMEAVTRAFEWPAEDEAVVRGPDAGDDLAAWVARLLIQRGAF